MTDGYEILQNLDDKLAKDLSSWTTGLGAGTPPSIPPSRTADVYTAQVLNLPFAFLDANEYLVGNDGGTPYIDFRGKQLDPVVVTTSRPGFLQYAANFVADLYTAGGRQIAYQQTQRAFERSQSAYFGLRQYGGVQGEVLADVFDGIGWWGRDIAPKATANFVISSVEDIGNLALSAGELDANIKLGLLGRTGLTSLGTSNGLSLGRLSLPRFSADTALERQVLADSETAIGIISLFAGGVGALRGGTAIGVTRAGRGGMRMFSPGDLMGVERASPELIASISSKRSVVIAQPGSDELRLLDYFGAEASVNTAKNGIRNGSIILRENPSKAALLEEFLHGTQARLGIIDRLGSSGFGSAETHVKDFMIRHQNMLGLIEEDVAILKTLRDRGL